MIRLLPVFLVSGVDSALAVLLFYAAYRLFEAWRITGEGRVAAFGAGLAAVAASSLAEALVTASFAAAWRGGVGVPWALAGLFAAYPFTLLYIAGYASLLLGYRGSGSLLVAVLLAPAGLTWAGLQAVSALLSGLVAVTAHRGGAERLFALGFAVVAVSHLVGVMPSPRLLLASASLRALGFAVVVYGLGVWRVEEA